MSALHHITPYTLPDIFTEIVAEVSANLASDGVLGDVIPHVNFKHGTWADICASLTSESRASTTKNVKFPLVCLIYKADENFIDKYNNDAVVDILICTNTQPAHTNEKRYELIIKPVLIPIYAELKAVIAKSRYFWGFASRFQHTKTDLPHAGQESADGPNPLSGIIDGIYLKGCKFRIRNKRLAYTQPNLCLLTGCPYGMETYYRNIFKNVTFTGLSTTTITASVNSYAFTDASGGLPPPFAPEISWEGGAFVPMAAPVSPATNWTATFNLSTGQGDGFYIGEIRFNDAKVQFYYKVAGGQAAILTTEILQDIDYSVLCADYPDYPVTVNASCTIEVTGAETLKLVGYSLVVFGVTKVNNAFAAVETYQLETDTTLAHMVSNDEIHNNFSYGGQAPLNNISVVMTRCKTEF